MGATRDRRPYLVATSVDQSLLDEMASNLNSQIEFVVDVNAPDGSIIRASNRNKYIEGVWYAAILEEIPSPVKTLGEWLQAGLDFSTVTISILNVLGQFNNFTPGGSDYKDWTGLALSIRIGLFDIGASYQTIFEGFITDIGGFGRSQRTINITARDRYDTLNKQFPTAIFNNVTWPDIEDSLIGTIIPIVYGDYTTINSRTPAMIPAFPVNGADLEVIGGPNGDEELTAASGTVAVVNNTFDAGDAVIVNTVSFTLDTEWTAGVDTDASAIAIRDAINASVNVLISGVVTAALDGSIPSTIIITAVVPGQAGNAIPLSLSDGATLNFNITAFSGGFDDKRHNVQMVISENDNTVFQTENVYYRVNAQEYVKVPATEITAVSVGKNQFEIKQVSPINWIPEPDGEGGVILSKYRFSGSDEFFVRVKGKALGGAGFDTNAVSIVKDILKTYGGVTDPDFDPNFETYRIKSSPAQSAIANIPVRAWIREQQVVVEYTLQIFEQIRIEYFIERSAQLIKINSLHFEDINTASSIVVRNWDIGRNSLTMTTSDTHFINQAQGAYDLNPALDGNSFNTEFYENPLSISNTKTVAKQISFPNIESKSDVINQLIEILRMSSSNFEILNINMTSRALLQDLGDFIIIDVQIGSTIFNNVPCQIREIGYGNSGNIQLKVWSYLMMPYPGYNSGAPGIVGGFDATISLSS